MLSFEQGACLNIQSIFHSWLPQTSVIIIKQFNNLNTIKLFSCPEQARFYVEIVLKLFLQNGGNLPPLVVLVFMLHGCQVANGQNLSKKNSEFNICYAFFKLS